MMDIQTIESSIYNIIKEHVRFNGENVASDSDLRDTYGIDSIILVEVLIEIEEFFGITIDSNLLTYDSFSTPKSIADYVYNKLNV